MFLQKIELEKQIAILNHHSFELGKWIAVKNFDWFQSKFESWFSWPIQINRGFEWPLIFPIRMNCVFESRFISLTQWIVVASRFTWIGNINQKWIAPNDSRAGTFLNFIVISILFTSYSMSLAIDILTVMKAICFILQCCFLVWQDFLTFLTY